jgi:hypothetical protein
MVIASKAKQSCSFKEIATHLAGARNDWLIKHFKIIIAGFGLIFPLPCFPPSD